MTPAVTPCLVRAPRRIRMIQRAHRRVEYTREAPSSAVPTKQTTVARDGALSDQRFVLADRITVRIIAQGRYMTVYQAQSRPASRLCVGSHVELYSSTGGYTGVSRRVVAMRSPEPSSLDLILQHLHDDEPAIVLNVTTCYDWVAVPLWIKLVRLFSRSASTIAYPKPILAPAPPAASLGGDAVSRQASTLEINENFDDEQAR